MRITHFILNGAVACAALGAAVQTAPPAPPSLSSAADNSAISEFAVASIRQNVSNDGAWRLGFTKEGYSALGASVKQLIEDSYGIFDDDRIHALPKWADSEKYDVEAKVDPVQLSAWQGMNIDQRRAVLQALLRDRFQLHVQKATEMRPIYALVVAKGGPKLKATPPENAPTGVTKGTGARVRRIQRGQLVTEWQTTASFANLLFQLGLVDRHVLDMTGLTGHYDITLTWDPADTAAPASPLTPPVTPAIFAPLREELGLELKPRNGPVEVIIIDHVERPSAN
jgi:uncharacterized protein (TIGR03435 family)